MNAIGPTQFSPPHLFPRRLLALTLLVVMSVPAAMAQPPAHRAGPTARVPSAEQLATIPSLSSAQQVELHKLLVERRDAMESAREKSRAAYQVQRKRDRAERERIDQDYSTRMRQALGEEGFASFAKWQSEQRAERAERWQKHGGHGAMQRGKWQRGPNATDGAPAAPETSPAEPDGNL